jgi:predicted MFS family arabinose efflux permease
VGPCHAHRGPPIRSHDPAHTGSAGFLLATAGASTAFFLNGVSFVAVIGAIWMVNPIVAERRAATTTTVLQGFGEAIVYIRRRQGILLSMLCAILVAFFGNPITQFTVVFAQDVYNSGPRVLGLLAAAVGIGAVLIAPALSTWDTRIPRSSVVRWGLPFYALAVIAFGVAPNWPLGVIALLMVGAGFLLVIATTNTAVQLMVDEEMRGRVMSARVMSFTLAFPLGSLLQGYLSDIWGPQATVVVMGAILLGLAILVATQPTWLLTLDEE